MMCMCDVCIVTIETADHVESKNLHNPCLESKE